MSRHTNADIIRRGYEAQRDGKVDAVLAEADTMQGQLYRTGLRERRREEADQKDGTLATGAPVLPRVAHEVEVAVTPRGLVVVADSKPILPITSGPGAAFADPEPKAKRTRKARPADAGQGSLFG